MKYVIGIVGGIACGKSYIANILKEKNNATIINADQIAHKHLSTEYVHNKLKRRWANRFDIFNLHNKEFRTAIAKIIFNDKKELKFFEKLMGPLINKEIIKTIKSTEGLIVLDMPLLFEAKMDKWCNTIWYISIEEQTRMLNFSHRYIGSGKTIDEILKDFHARENRQISTTEKSKRANRIIFNHLNSDNSLTEEIDELLKMENVANILRLCKDCKWCKLDNRNKEIYSECLSPNNANGTTIYSSVSGENKIEKQVKWIFCDTHRGYNLNDRCGTEGKWFKPKGELNGKC